MEENSYSDFEFLERKYKTYLDTLDPKRRLAHEVAFEVLGSSYQLPYTMDYLEYKERMKKEGNESLVNNPPANEPAVKEEIVEKKIRRIKRKKIKRKNKKDA